MSYELKKPITEKQRADFIVQYNHVQGLRIEDTEMYLFALEDNEIMGTKEVEIDPNCNNLGNVPSDHTEKVKIPYPVINPNYEEEQAKKERERILRLSMTRSDFFDGIIRAFGLDDSELLLVIQHVLEQLAIDETEKKIALNNYKNALNFYRKHPLFNMLSDIEIPITQNMVIIITAEQWDVFFDETSKRNPDAYKALLPPEVEETEEEVEE